MKYWRGYLTAALFAGLTLALQKFAKSYGDLLDMVYPYVTRMIQDILTGWSSGFDFCLWQVLIGVLAILLIASVVLMVVLRWNFFQWLGWVLAFLSIGFCLNTGIYGLNTECGPLANDIRLNVTKFITTELVSATTYYRDKANELAAQVSRDEAGDLLLPAFEEMAAQAGNGFQTLTYERSYPVFGGETTPVKKLGMADSFTARGISGITVPFTGEAAVNPQIPGVAIPFAMCREMARRMCITKEADANLAAFLTCQANSDPLFQYVGYLAAYRYCYTALINDGTSTAKNAAQTIQAGLDSMAQKELADIPFDESAYQEVCTLLVSWYIQEVYMPGHQDEVEKFDPMDPDQVDLDYTVGG